MLHLGHCHYPPPLERCRPWPLVFVLLLCASCTWHAGTVSAQQAATWDVDAAKFYNLSSQPVVISKGFSPSMPGPMHPPPLTPPPPLGFPELSAPPAATAETPVPPGQQPQSKPHSKAAGRAASPLLQTLQQLSIAPKVTGQPTASIASCNISAHRNEVNISCSGPVSMGPSAAFVKIRHATGVVRDERCLPSSAIDLHNYLIRETSVAGDDAGVNQMLSAVTLCSTAHSFHLSGSVQGMGWSLTEQEDSPWTSGTSVAALTIMASGNVVLGSMSVTDTTLLTPLAVYGAANITVVNSTLAGNNLGGMTGVDSMTGITYAGLRAVSSSNQSHVTLNNVSFVANSAAFPKSLFTGFTDRAPVASIRAASVGSTVRIINCSFIDNNAAGLDVQAYHGSVVEMQHNMFRNNSRTAALIDSSEQQDVAVLVHGEHWFEAGNASGLHIFANLAINNLVAIVGNVVFVDNEAAADSFETGGALKVEMEAGVGCQLALGIRSDFSSVDGRWSGSNALRKVAKRLRLPYQSLADESGQVLFRNNTSTGNAGGLYFSLQSASGCGVYVSGPVTFQGNVALQGGGGGAFVNLYNASAVDVVLHDTKWVGNIGGGLATEHGASSSVLMFINSSEFSGNTGISLKDSALSVSFGGGALSPDTPCATADSMLWLNDVKFQHNTANGGAGGALGAVSSACDGQYGQFGETTLLENVGDLATGQRLLEYIPLGNMPASIQGMNVLFLNNSAAYGGAVYTAGVTMTLYRSRFVHNTASAHGGGAYCKDVPALLLYAAHFAGNRASQHGGGMYSTTDITSDFAPYIRAASSTFTGNTAGSGQGGGLYVAVPYLELLNCTIANNTAAQQGGGIMMDSQCIKVDEDMGCGPSVGNGTIIHNNTADAGGGVFLGSIIAAKKTDLKGLREAAPASLNSARFSAGVSVTPSKLKLLPPAQPTTAMALFPGKETATSPEAAAQLRNSSSSSSSGMMVMHVASSTDVVGLIPLRVITDERGVRVEVDFCLEEEAGEAYITGAVASSGKDGVAVFEGLRLLRGQQGRTYCMRVLTPHYPEVAPVLFAIHIRPCVPGELYLEGSCFRCIPGLYNFRAGAACRACEANAECSGGAVLVPHKGYWHSAPNSSDVQRCPNVKACGSGEGRSKAKMCQSSRKCDEMGNAGYSDLLCGVGYRGNLCGSCRKDQGYGEGQYFRCSRCLSGWAIVGLIIVFGALTACLIGFVAYKTVRDASLHPAAGMFTQGTVKAVASSHSSAHSPHLQLNMLPQHPQTLPSQQAVEVTEVFKVLAIYLQYLSIIGNLLVDWPDTIMKLVNVVKLLVASGSSGTAALGCFVDLSNGSKMVLSAGLPLGIIAVSCLGVVGRVRPRTWLQGGSHPAAALAVSDCFIVTVAVGLFLFYSSLVGTSLSAFSCVPVDGTAYWVRDMDVKCWSKAHLQASMGVGVAGCVLLCLLTPGAIIVWLLLNRASLGMAAFKRRYGFLYKLYKPRYCYWEGVMCMQTVLMVMVDLFVRSQGAPYQLLLLVVVLNSGVMLAALVRPFRCRQLSRLYILGMACLLLTCLGVMSFLEGFQLSSEHLTHRVRSLVAGLVMAVNLGFLTVCVLLMLRSGLTMVRRWLLSCTCIAARLRLHWSRCWGMCRLRKCWSGWMPGSSSSGSSLIDDALQAPQNTDGSGLLQQHA